MLERNASVTNELAPAGRDADARHAAAPPRRFRHARRSARLCGDGPARAQFPRRARHADPRLSLCRAARGRAGARAPLHRARHQAGRPHRAGRRDRPRIRRLLLRRGLCRRLAGAAAAADQLRRARSLCRPARRPARQLRSGAVPLSRPSSPTSASGAADQARRRRRATGKRSTRSSRPPATLPTREPDDIAYLQYSSGSTRFPHGVAVTHRALLDNLHAHGVGLEVERHRPRASPGCPGTTTWAWSAASCRRSRMQMSVDYLKTEDFARRPLAWLDMITRNPGTSRQLLADLRLRHLLAPDELADPRRGPLRPVALADRRQRRRHDPPRRHAGVRRLLRRRPASRPAPSARATASPKRRSRSR